MIGAVCAHEGVPTVVGIGFMDTDSMRERKTLASVTISSELEEPKALVISAEQSIKLRTEYQAYLEFHRSEIFMK